MRRRGKTILETVFPHDAAFGSFVPKWRASAYGRMLQWIWDAYDLLDREILSKVDWGQAEDDLEREITEMLEVRIRRSMPDLAPMYVQQEKKERETRVTPKAQPPEYDLAFVLHANERICWPLEAKVLHTDQATAKYIKQITDNFLTCRYAPFSEEGGMLGYLLAGDPAETFRKIAVKLNARLQQHAMFPGRPHKTSEHKRNVPTGKTYPRSFRCHHLILELVKS